MRDDDYSGPLKPGLSIHLHRQLVRTVHDDLGVAALGYSLVLDPQDFGRGYLRDPRDSDHLHKLVVIGGS